MLVMFMSIKVKCPAKINLFFNIVGLDDRSYHLVHALNQSVSLYDILDINKTDTGIHLRCDKNDVPVDYKNSVYKAAQLFFEYTKINSGIEINITKNIPLMSGLGGESTDAAGTLIGLNKLFDTNLSLEELICLGYKVGCDVPFCIVGGTCEIKGCGEVVKPVGTNYKYFIIVTPEHGFSTKYMFNLYDENTSEYENIDITIGHNSFHKVLDDNTLNLISIVGNSGSINSFLTGSGSSVVGIFDSEEKLNMAYDELCSKLGDKYTINKVYSVCGVEVFL